MSGVVGRWIETPNNGLLEKSVIVNITKLAKKWQDIYWSDPSLILCYTLKLDKASWWFAWNQQLKTKTLRFQSSCVQSRHDRLRYLSRSLSFEGEQQKIEHTGTRKKFSPYISMLWSDQKLMYDFYNRMNSTNTIDYLENLRKYVINRQRLRLSYTAT